MRAALGWDGELRRCCCCCRWLRGSAGAGAADFEALSGPVHPSTHTHLPTLHDTTHTPTHTHTHHHIHITRARFWPASHAPAHPHHPSWAKRRHALPCPAFALPLPCLVFSSARLLGASALTLRRRRCCSACRTARLLPVFFCCVDASGRWLGPRRCPCVMLSSASAAAPSAPACLPVSLSRCLARGPASTLACLAGAWRVPLAS